MSRSPRTFRSDNNAGVCPEALEAMVRAASSGHAIGYGDDESTAAAAQAIKSVFGGEAAVFFVATGTIANGLAIAAITRPWQRVLCHVYSHWNDDESTSPERMTGCRTTAIRGATSKLTPDEVEQAAETSRKDVHQPQPGVLTISNPTEFGEVYTPEETQALCERAHAIGYRVHVDGARFANAVAGLDCSPRALTNDAGVDALTFGGTKNGLALGEAVVFFPQGDGSAFDRAQADFPFIRKSTGALLSKHRFVTAPFAATVSSGAWLRHAAHADAMARRMRDGLGRLGISPRFPVQANAVFAPLGRELDRALRERGHAYYPFGPEAWGLSRLMCSFDTQEADVDAFLSDAAAALAGGVRVTSGGQ